MLTNRTTSTAIRIYHVRHFFSRLVVEHFGWFLALCETHEK